MPQALSKYKKVFQISKKEVLKGSAPLMMSQYRFPYPSKILLTEVILLITLIDHPINLITLYSKEYKYPPLPLSGPGFVTS
jgi:hypothetical protein